MLVLTRKRNQSISVGDNILITVLGVEADRVSLGVEAPREVRVFRSELLEGTKTVNRDSVGSTLWPLRTLKKEE
ncbi:MAG: carbon storage regulator [Oscillospiraceae bacterium]|jgi:carbon storage regulator|nr:carbon storage regulator [Oscillospiraceae bacterium]